MKRETETERRNDSHGNIRTLELALHMPADDETSAWLGCQSYTGF